MKNTARCVECEEVVHKANASDEGIDGFICMSCLWKREVGDDCGFDGNEIYKSEFS